MESIRIKENSPELLELNLHPIAADGWHPLKDNYNPGYIKSISSEEATKIMAKFNKEEWPSKWKKVKEITKLCFNVT